MLASHVARFARGGSARRLYQFNQIRPKHGFGIAPGTPPTEKFREDMNEVFSIYVNTLGRIKFFDSQNNDKKLVEVMNKMKEAEKKAKEEAEKKAEETAEETAGNKGHFMICCDDNSKERLVEFYRAALMRRQRDYGGMKLKKFPRE